MAVGDDAIAAGYSIVPDTGEEGRVRWGAREINRTRDYLAQFKTLIAAKPRTAAGTILNLQLSSTGSAVFYHNLGWLPKYMSFQPRLGTFGNVIAIWSGAGSLTTAHVTIIAYDQNNNRYGATSFSQIDWFAHE